MQTGDTGFISVDFKFNYLGSNETAKTVFPELNDLAVDRPLAASPLMTTTVCAWLAEFAQNGTIE